MAGLRVLVIADDIRAGHLPGAHTLTEQLAQQPEVDDVELVTDPSALGSRSARWLSRRLPGRAGALAGAALGHRALAQSFNAFRPHVVVSESPGLSAVLGQLRSVGRLPHPLVTVSSAPAAGFPALRGVDMHLVFSPEALSEVEAISGPGTAIAVQPLVDRQFLHAPARGASRATVARQLKVSLKGGRPLVLISADAEGGAGAGAGAGTGAEAGAGAGAGTGAGAGAGADLAGAVADAAEVTLDTVADAVAVVIVGEPPELAAELRNRFAGSERLRVLGPADRRATLFAAADALIDITGGGARLEAHLLGCPLISYGHMAHAHDGGAECAHSRSELGPALARTLERERPSPVAVGELARAVDVVIATAYGLSRTN